MKNLIFSILALTQLAMEAGATAKAPTAWACERWAEQPAIYECSNGFSYAYGTAWCRVAPESSPFDHQMYTGWRQRSIFCGATRKDSPFHCERDMRPQVIACAEEMASGGPRVRPLPYPGWPATPPYVPPGQGRGGYGPGTPVPGLPTR